MKKAFKIIIAIIILINLSACSNTNKSSQELETTVTIQLSDTSEPSQWIRQADSIKIIDYSETVSILHRSTQLHFFCPIFYPKP